MNFSKFTRMNLIFVKNLGFSIVCERFPYLYLWGGEADHVLLPLVYRKWGSAPSPRAQCARRLLRCCFVCILIGILCSYIGGNSLRSFSGAGGYHDPLHWYRLCAVMGTRQRFPEVHCLWCVPHDICKMSVGILRCSNGD